MCSGVAAAWLRVVPPWKQINSIACGGLTVPWRLFPAPCPPPPAPQAQTAPGLAGLQQRMAQQRAAAAAAAGTGADGAGGSNPFDEDIIPFADSGNPVMAQVRAVTTHHLRVRVYVPAHVFAWRG